MISGEIGVILAIQLLRGIHRRRTSTAQGWYWPRQVIPAVRLRDPKWWQRTFVGCFWLCSLPHQWCGAPHPNPVELAV